MKSSQFIAVAALSALSVFGSAAQARTLAGEVGLIEAPTLVLWGECDAILPQGYAHKLAIGIGKAARVETIAGAGHLAYLDQPDAVSKATLAHLG